MGRMSVTTEVSTTASVGLRATVKEKLKTLVERLATRRAERKVLEKKDKEDKAEIETLFLDNGEEEALTAGVEISTSAGMVPVKMITDTGFNKDGSKKKGKLDEVKVMKKFNLTVKDLDSCRKKYEPRKSYLGVYIPGDDDDDD